MHEGNKNQLVFGVCVMVWESVDFPKWNSRQFRSQCYDINNRETEWNTQKTKKWSTNEVFENVYEIELKIKRRGNRQHSNKMKQKSVDRTRVRAWLEVEQFRSSVFQFFFELIQWNGQNNYMSTEWSWQNKGSKINCDFSVSVCLALLLLFSSSSSVLSHPREKCSCAYVYKHWQHKSRTYNDIHVNVWLIRCE